MILLKQSPKIQRTKVKSRQTLQNRNQQKQRMLRIKNEKQIKVRLKIHNQTGNHLLHLKVRKIVIIRQLAMYSLARLESLRQHSKATLTDTTIESKKWRYRGLKIGKHLQKWSMICATNNPPKHAQLSNRLIKLSHSSWMKMEILNQKIRQIIKWRKMRKTLNLLKIKQKKNKSAKTLKFSRHQLKFIKQKLLSNIKLIQRQPFKIFKYKMKRD